MEEKEKVIEIEIERLRDFKEHPFHVKDDKEMSLLKESIKNYGILSPLIVRPVLDGVYEIVSGHRRKYAAQQLSKREIEKGRSESGRTARAYGRYQNVFLTDGELADLQASFPTVWGQYIEKLSEYMASTGKRYQSHAATIRRWAGEDAKKAAPPSRNRDYSVKEDETV